MVAKPGLADFISADAPSARDVGTSTDDTKSNAMKGEAAQGYSLVDPDPNVSFAVLFQQAKGIQETLEQAKNGARDAAAEIMEKFGVENKVQKVSLTEDFVAHMADKNGVPASEFHPKDIKFGVLTLDAADPKAQFERLQDDVAKMQSDYGKFFGNLEVYRGQKDQATGKEVAIVVGLDKQDVDLFNSLRKAEAAHQQLQQTMQVVMSPDRDAKKEVPDVGIKENKIEELAAMYPKREGQEAAVSSDPVAPKPVYAPGMPQKSGIKEVA
jgi:hypothetical protein